MQKSRMTVRVDRYDDIAESRTADAPLPEAYIANDTTSTDYESRITPKRVILFLDILLMF